MLSFWVWRDSTWVTVKHYVRVWEMQLHHVENLLPFLAPVLMLPICMSMA